MSDAIYGSLLCAFAFEANAQTAPKMIAKPAAVAAHPQKGPAFEGIRPLIVTTKPKTKADKVDQERLTVRRLDVVDADGTIRLSVAGTP